MTAGDEMLDINLLRGLAMMMVALFFGLNALRYPIGDLARAGPALFPLLVSGALFVLALLSVIQSRRMDPEPLDFRFRNIGLIVLSLATFVLASHYVSVLLGIILLVFISGLAASNYSWKRNVMLSAVLILVALVFQHGLGLNLGLI
jgi:hypothetical protein